jgi:hypothetical protein
VDEQVGGFAFGRQSTATTSSTVGLNFRASGTTDAEMGVPDTDSTWYRAGNVNFQQSAA